MKKELCNLFTQNGRCSKGNNKDIYIYIDYSTALGFIYNKNLLKLLRNSILKVFKSNYIHHHSIIVAQSYNKKTDAPNVMVSHHVSFGQMRRG